MKKIYFIIGILLAVGSFVFSFDTEAQTTPTISDRDTLDAILDNGVEQGYYPFFYARLEKKNGEPFYEHSAVNNRLIDSEINGQTWIRIWSMSKLVTISVTLDLVEEGFLSLDDPVVKYIPEFKHMKVAVTQEGTPLHQVQSDSAGWAYPYREVPAESVMTVRHLINHQAGFYYSTTNFPCLDSLIASKNLAASKNTKEFIDKLAELPLIQHPGTEHYYGLNTTVLGFVAERATQKSLARLVKERLTAPCGIDGLQYDLPQEAKLQPRISGKDSLLREAHPGELDIFGQDVPDYKPEHKLYLGGEGMIATADGYADFLRMLLNGGKLNGYRFLDEATVKEIHAPHTQLDSPHGYNGYNLWVSNDSMRVNQKGDAGLWIGGGYEGTHFWVDPKRDFVGVVMTQMFWIPEGGYGLIDNFRGALYQQFFKNEKSGQTSDSYQNYDTISKGALKNKITGYWNGQLVGNYMGFPFEFKYFDQPIPKLIDRYYNASDSTDLKMNTDRRAYVHVLGKALGGAWSDDDTDIEFVTLHAVEKYGLDITYPEIAEAWKTHINRFVWGSNRQARQNMEKGLIPPATGDKKNNQYWYHIDPQLVNEIWSAFYPGMPEKAVERAQWGAHITNDDWGTHPTMFYAALYSAAFTTSDIMKIYDRAMKYIPGSSPFKKGLKDVKKWYKQNKNWKETRALIKDNYYNHPDIKEPHQAVSAMVNGLFGAMAILYGNGDFMKTTGIAISAGLDCDNQGATCAGFVGVLNGGDAIPHHLTTNLGDGKIFEKPFNNQYINYSRDKLPNHTLITELVDRIAAIAEDAILENGGKKFTRNQKTYYKIPENR